MHTKVLYFVLNSKLFAHYFKKKKQATNHVACFKVNQRNRLARREVNLPQFLFARLIRYDYFTTTLRVVPSVMRTMFTPWRVEP